MNKTTEALKLSLQRFESMNHEDSIFRFEFEDEIAAIREALAEPLKQEPVAYAPIITFRDSQLYQVSKQLTPEFCNPLYAAPVDAKAIRAEALEEAAKVCDKAGDSITVNHIAAAIRGLK